MIMSKKQFVAKMLEKLYAVRPMARDLNKFLQMWALDNNAVNSLTELIKQTAVYIKNEQAKNNLLKVAQQLENMKHAELQEQVADQQEAEQILATL